MSARVTYLTMDYLDMCFQNDNWWFSSSKSQQVLLSRFHISLTCNARNGKISRSAAGVSNMACGESFDWRCAGRRPAFRTANALIFWPVWLWTELRMWRNHLMLVFPSQRRRRMCSEESVLVKISIRFILWLFKVCGIQGQQWRSFFGSIGQVFNLLDDHPHALDTHPKI